MGISSHAPRDWMKRFTAVCSSRKLVIVDLLPQSMVDVRVLFIVHSNHEN
jgi:hypothetical protein